MKFKVFVKKPMRAKMRTTEIVMIDKERDGVNLRHDLLNFAPERKLKKAIKTKRVGKIPHSIIKMEIAKIKGLRRYEGAGITF